MHHLYKITNISNNMSYIGVTNDLERRKKEHFSGKGNSLIHSDFDSSTNWVFEVLDSGNEDYIYALEPIAILEHNTINPSGYNIAPGGYGILPNAKGSNNSQAKLTEEVVLNIRNEYATNSTTQKQLANDYGVSTSAISKLLLGNTWKEVGGPISSNKQGTPKLSKDNVLAIRSLYDSGCSQSTIAKKFNVAKSNINSIVNYRTWTDI